MKITIENTYPKMGLEAENTVKYTYEDDSWDSSFSGMMKAFEGLLKAMGYVVEDEE